MALSFRRRIFGWLLVVAVIPAAIAVAAVALAPRFAAPVGGSAAWEEAAESWRTAEEALASTDLDPAVQAALQRHSDDLRVSLRRARQAQAIRSAFSGLLAGVAVALAVLVAGGAVRLAGHLSRQMSRPIDELVHWTALLRRGEQLPEATQIRGAPEFTILRKAFRDAARELERARNREVEAAQLRAFREMARQVAHELKNPLTPMRLAIARLARSATPESQDTIDVLDAESARIERMAREFGELGRLPEGPPAPVDLGDILEELARAGAPDGIEVRVERGEGPLVVPGHYEALRRALQNLVLNAFDAVTGPGQAGNGRGTVVLAARPSVEGERSFVEVTVRDSGPGIPPADVSRIFEPYFTTKPGGTGLGLAIVRQTVHDHGGELNVGSGPGGTEFRVTLPAAADVPAESR